ncbi:hypothetical protein K3495_g7678 [Podosphaera aphanis]|nr:hypothetical protein K3495_g7678 [Podosphaera aphanis]
MSLTSTSLCITAAIINFNSKTINIRTENIYILTFSQSIIYEDNANLIRTEKAEEVEEAPFI